MKTNKWIGFLLIMGSIGVFVPYTMLTMSFEYPDILRQDAGVVLTKFHEGGASLIFTWWAFAILGTPLLVAYVLIGKQWKHLPFMSWVTTFGVYLRCRADSRLVAMGVCHSCNCTRLCDGQ